MRKEKLIPIICACLVIPSRMWLFWKVTHCPNPTTEVYRFVLMKADYSKDAILYLIIGLLLFCIAEQARKNIKYRQIVNAGMYFSYSMSLFCLYPFLPTFISQYILYFAYVFYCFWTAVFIINVVWIFIYFKRNYWYEN